jgi:hypothetical protein
MESARSYYAICIPSIAVETGKLHPLPMNIEKYQA